MKNILKVLGFAACLSFVACEDQFKELDKGNDVLTLTAPQEEIVLDEVNHADQAINLSWTTGTNYGTGNRISYTLVFNANGNTATEELGTGVYSWKRTVEQLNNFLVDKLGAAHNEKVALNVALTASVYGHEEMAQKVDTTINVTTYLPLTKTLYMIGDATKGGWSLDNATELTRTDNGKFTVTTKLLGGKDFKFIVSKNGFEPGYNRDANAEGKLVYRATGADPDEKFQVPEDGNYELNLNLFDLTISIEKSAGPTERFEEVFFVGSFSSWNFIPMTHDPLVMNMWYYGAMFNDGNGGEFKFGTVKDWNSMLFASEPNAPYTSTGVIYNHGEDWKWFLKEEERNKPYRIYLDVTAGKERMLMKEFQGFNGMWLIGSATPAGWDLANATPMTDAGNFVYKWTGHLNTGELKFSCDKDTSWNGKWFLAAVNGSNPTGEEENMLFLDKSDGFYAELYPELNVKDIDQKWNVSEAGEYEITLNVLTQKVTIKKK